MAVTAIVVLGTDMDVLYALPLGIFAGALATFFITLLDTNSKLEERKRRIVSRTA